MGVKNRTFVILFGLILLMSLYLLPEYIIFNYSFLYLIAFVCFCFIYMFFESKRKLTHYQNLYEKFPFGIVVVDKTYHIIYKNPSYEQDFQDYFSREDGRIEEALLTLSYDGETITDKVQLWHDVYVDDFGETKRLRISTAAIDADGHRAFFIKDFDNPAAYDQKIDELQTLLEYAPLILIILNTKNKVIYLNHPATMFFDQYIDDPTGKDFRELMAGLGIQFNGWAAKNLPENDSLSFDVDDMSWTIVANTIHTQNDDLICVCLFQHTRQTTVDKSKENYHIMFNDAPLGIMLLDNQGLIVNANRHIIELLSEPWQNLENKKFVDMLTEESNNKFSSVLININDNEPFQNALDIHFTHLPQSTITVYIQPIETIDGQKKIMLNLVDSTTQKQLELQFVQSQKMQAVGQLAGGIAHDFNNLLTAMIGFCDLLLLRHSPGEQSFMDVMQIKQNANRAANLVRQLLAFSRQQTLQPKILNVADAISELSSLLRRLIGANIELKVMHSRDLGSVKVDQIQLEQVIINLAVNARDAMPHGGGLTIRTSNQTIKKPYHQGHDTMPPGDYVLIEVIDTGTGIPPNIIDRIFEPFFSTKQVGSGTGLGLSTVYGIVKQTDGYIFVDSIMGKGSRFRIFLPSHKAEEETMKSDSNTNNPHDMTTDLTGAANILLVEDEGAVRMFTARALRDKGYHVLEAASGDEALDVLNQTDMTIDLIITDVVMPKMDGPTMINKVREKFPSIQVIFISGYAEDSFRRHLTSDTNIHFLPKPFNLKEVALKVKEVLRP